MAIGFKVVRDFKLARDTGWAVAKAPRMTPEN